MKPTRIQTLAGVLTAAVVGAAAAGVVAHAGSRAATVTVTEKEFKIALSASKVQAGATRFVVMNKGHFAHALALSGPGVKLKKTALIRPGKTASLTVTLASGTYTLWCPVPGHAARGMKSRLTVAGAAKPATTSSGGTTTSGGGGGAWG